MTQDRLYWRLVFAFLICMILAQAIFAAWPGIDLSVSRRFAAETGGFPWADGPLTLVNLVIRRAGEVVALAIVLLSLWGLLSRRMARGEQKLWGFVGLTVLLSSGVLSNLVLKAHVGRPRPADVADFGGSALFTPAFQISDHCARNCSFVSGEVSLAASLAIPLVVILWHRLDRPLWRFLALSIALGYVTVVSLLRIGLGRHFLSDAVFATLFSAGIALVLYPVLRVGAARRDGGGLPFLRLLGQSLGQRLGRVFVGIKRVERR